MEWFVSALITGITSFVATNIDDIVILMVFFAQVNDRLRPQHIIVGKYLGFILLLLACLPGFLGGLFLPKAWIGLLGFLPIVIGIKHWWEWQQEAPGVQTVSEELMANSEATMVGLAALLHPKIYHVAAVTFANGGDNIGIYVPLFASSDLPSLIVIVAVFLCLVAVWCGIAHYLASHPTIAPFLSRYAHRIVPLILIGLGVYILIENDSYRLFPTFSAG
ncbi:cadmium resistance transporter [Pantanalinema rosaneae CENA516]|uniref:cadmium resistance transporter n=1 Tax=Pantanalinema rosaneae TaxID=1620701 RepID=UPI003D6E232D